MSTPSGLLGPVPMAGPVRRQPVSEVRATMLLVRFGLRRSARTPAVWGGAMGVMGALMVAIWPSIDGQVGRLLSGYPEALKTAFGITDLSSADRYVDAEMLSMIVPFAVAALSIRVVVGTIAAAEDRGDLDTLLALPISRAAVAISAVWVAVAVSAGTLTVAWALTCAGSLLAGAGASAGALARGYGNVLPLASAAGGLAVLVCGARRGASAVTGITIATLVVMYLVDLAGRLEPALDRVRPVSAFAYYGSAVQNGLAAVHVAVLFAATVAATLIGVVLLQRRDLD